MLILRFTTHPVQGRLCSAFFWQSAKMFVIELSTLLFPPVLSILLLVATNLLENGANIIHFIFITLPSNTIRGEERERAVQLIHRDVRIGYDDNMLLCCWLEACCNRTEQQTGIFLKPWWRVQNLRVTCGVLVGGSTSAEIGAPIKMI